MKKKNTTNKTNKNKVLAHIVLQVRVYHCSGFLEAATSWKKKMGGWYDSILLHPSSCNKDSSTPLKSWTGATWPFRTAAIPLPMRGISSPSTRGITGIEAPQPIANRWSKSGSGAVQTGAKKTAWEEKVSACSFKVTWLSFPSRWTKTLKLQSWWFLWVRTPGASQLPLGVDLWHGYFYEAVKKRCWKFTFRKVGR